MRKKRVPDDTSKQVERSLLFQYLGLPLSGGEVQLPAILSAAKVQCVDFCL